MSAADRLRNAGFTISLNPTGGLVVAPATSLTHDLRVFIREHLDALKREVAVTPDRRCRAWRVVLTTGARFTALQPQGATRIEMLAILNENERWPGRVEILEAQV